MRTVFTIGIIAAGLWIAACIVLYIFQEQMIYFRVPEVDRPGRQSVRIPSGAASIQVWVLHQGKEPAVIYFGGNAEDVSGNLTAFEALFPEHAVYLVSYRGYGGSTGRPSEQALSQDALAVHDWVAQRHPRIVVMGRSLGTGVATTLAASRPVEALILVTPFDSLVNVAAGILPMFPVRWLLRDRFESAQRIGQVQAPILVLIAEDDEVISRARSDALIAAIPEALRHAEVIRHARHNDIDVFPAYRESIQRFLGRSLAL